MKIKVLHYVFGPCMKGYDVNEKEVVVQMGQKTIGLSAELLSRPEVMRKLEELAFGDAIDPNTPFEKIYFTSLPGNLWLIGRGIRGMDSAGRKAFFFHHLVIGEEDLINIKVNPFAVLRKFQFFEKETDLPEDRLIPPAEIEISPEDCEFPLVDAMNRSIIENLVADIFAKAPGQPMWVILKRGEECIFIEQLLSLLPINHRKQMSFSTDFYDSYNIQHYFRLVTVNTAQEIHYKDEKIYNFVDQEFPENPAEKNEYLKIISQLPIDEVKTMAGDISQLQIYYKDTRQLSYHRDILRTYLEKGKHSLAAFFETVPLEVAVVLLGVGHEEAEPDYQVFCDFYRHFLARIHPEWFIALYKPAPAPMNLFIALFQLLESAENIGFKEKVFMAVEGHLKTSENGSLMNLLSARFPDLFQEMMEGFQKETQRLYYLAQLPDLETGIRIQITLGITNNLSNLTKIYETDRNLKQLPSLIEFLDNLEIDTNVLKIFHELYTIQVTRQYPARGLEKYSLDETLYRKLVRLGMNTVNDKDSKKTFPEMCDYLYVPVFKRVFFEVQLAFIRDPELGIDPLDLLEHWETRDWVDHETRQEIFAFLEEGTMKLSHLKKYKGMLKKAGKNQEEYEPIWEKIEENARRGLVGTAVKKVKDFIGF